MSPRPAIPLMQLQSKPPLHPSLPFIYDVRREKKEGAMVLATAKLTEKFQITIPTEVRKRLHLQSGDLVYLALEGGQIVLRACPGSWTESSRGLGAEVWSAEGGAEAAIERERESWE
jgi:AbrB family looped-hinge helix DNA binding protein